jgi:hypothetical protein
MRLASIRYGFALATALIAQELAAAPVDITTGIATGVLYLTSTSEDLSDGLQITQPYQDYLKNKEYTAQIVPSGSDERSEPFAAINGMRDFGFGSAVSDGKGAVEVGVFNTTRTTGFWIALSRYYTTIKNNTEEELEFDFFFKIEPGELAIDDIRSDFTANARVEATIDYLLLTPVGGTNDESTGQLLDYFADIAFDGDVTKSPNADLTLVEKNDFKLLYVTEPLASSVSLPTIPGFGELTFYYDMFAVFSSVRFEVGGHAQLGDPTDLVGNEGGRLVQRPTEPSQVPEPASILLVGAGLLAIGATRRK